MPSIALVFRVLAPALLFTLPCRPGAIMSVTGVDWSRGGYTWLNADGVDEQGYAGVITILLDGGPTRYVFCVDLFTSVSVGDVYPVNYVAPDLVANGGRAAWLYANALATVTSATLGQGFQLALWDIVHDGGDGFTAGRVRASASTAPTVLAAANSYLALSAGQFSLQATVFRHVDGPLARQQLLGEYFPPDISTPEPATWCLLGSGGLGLILLRRRSPAR